MASNFHTAFSQKKVTAGKPPGARAAGPKAGMPMKTAAWPTPGPLSKSGFNRKTKVKALKNSPVRAGLH